MCKILVSDEILARSEDRKEVRVNEARLSGLVWTGLRLLGTSTYFTPASPLKRVFLWARFHLTARKRQQVRNPCSGLLVIRTRGLANPNGKRVMAAPEWTSIPVQSQPGGSLRQTKSIGQTRKPVLALGKLAPCCQEDEQKALDKIDESSGSSHIHRLGR